MNSIHLIYENRMVAKMSNARKMNRFKKRLYDEFEDHAYKVLGVSGDRVREVLGERGHDIDADF